MFNASTFRHWVRHTAIVPKGFLRFYILKLLHEKPMSGSDIIQTIEEHTSGKWRPSPGSIYPLISWLQEHGYVEEAPEIEVGKKYYALTKKGESFFKEHLRWKQQLYEKFGSFTTFFFELFWTDIPSKKISKLCRARVKLMKAMWNLRDALKSKFSENAINRTVRVLESAANDIEEIIKSLKGMDEED